MIDCESFRCLVSFTLNNKMKSFEIGKPRNLKEALPLQEAINFGVQSALTGTLYGISKGFWIGKSSLNLIIKNTYIQTTHPY